MKRAFCEKARRTHNVQFPMTNQGRKSASRFVLDKSAHQSTDLQEVIPIPVRKLPKICEDFIPRQGSADAACPGGKQGGADAGLGWKTAKIR